MKPWLPLVYCDGSSLLIKWQRNECQMKCVSPTCVQRGSCSAGGAPGIEVAVLYTAKILYSTPLLRADLWWVLKLKQRIYLFSLLLLPLLFLSFSFLSTPLWFWGSLWTQRPLKNCPRFCLFKIGLIFSAEVLFKPSNRQKYIFRGGSCMEEVWELFCVLIINLVSWSNLLDKN